MAFARPALPPNIDKLILRLLQHINQFAVGGAEKFVEARIIAACEVKNQLVHGILLPEGKTVRLYRFSACGQTVPPLPLRQTACFQTACHFRRCSVTICAPLAAQGKHTVLQTVIDFILHIDRHLAELSLQYGVWIYVILFLIVFCETGLVVTPFLPGDSLLFAAGGIAAVGGMNIHLMVALLIAAAILGDAANFTIGKYFGARLFSNPDSKIFRQSHLAKTHAFYEKYGGKTIIIARFVPIVRTFAPFVAGMADMHYGRFIRYNIIGAIAWVVLFAYAGYFFANTKIVKENLSLVLAAIIVLSVLPAVVEIVRAKRAAKKQNG